MDKIPYYSTDMNLELGVFVMPNHFHGIIEYRRDAMHCVSTDNSNNTDSDYQNSNTLPVPISI